MTVSTKLMTADERLMLPDDGKRYELIEGVLNERALAGAVHGLTAMEAGVFLYQFAHPRGLGAGFVLSTDPDTVRAPDAAFVAAERLPSGDLPPGYLRLAPRLGSRSRVSHGLRLGTTGQDLHLARCRLVWVVYPATRSVAVYRSRENARVLGADDVLDGAPVFDGFSAEVRELFR